MKTDKKQPNLARKLYDKMHMFTDKEAWGLYKFAAYVEAGFWVFFILTIIYQIVQLPQYESVFAYGRSILGTAYAVYVIFVVLIVRSLEWGFGRFILALLAGALPLGSVVFERTVSSYRKKHPKYIAPPKNYDE